MSAKSKASEKVNEKPELPKYKTSEARVLMVEDPEMVMSNGTQGWEIFWRFNRETCNFEKTYLMNEGWFEQYPEDYEAPFMIIKQSQEPAQVEAETKEVPKE